MKKISCMLTGCMILAGGMMLVSGKLEACSIHDHGCRFHGAGRAALPNGLDPMAVNAGGLVGVLSWDNSNDLDIHGLLPDDNGPYVSTGSHRFGIDGNGNPRPGEPFVSQDEHERHIYYSQYDMRFQHGRARGYITGDVSGSSANPHEPCKVEGVASCEAISIIGNDLPLGVPFEFQAYDFNDKNQAPDPSPTKFHLRAYAIGRYVIVNSSHVREGVHGTLSNTGESSKKLRVILGRLENDPHAPGVLLYNTGNNIISGKNIKSLKNLYYLHNMYPIEYYAAKIPICFFSSRCLNDFSDSIVSIFPENKVIEYGKAAEILYSDDRRFRFAMDNPRTAGLIIGLGAAAAAEEIVGVATIIELGVTVESITELGLITESLFARRKLSSLISRGMVRRVVAKRKVIKRSISFIKPYLSYSSLKGIGSSLEDADDKNYTGIVADLAFTLIPKIFPNKKLINITKTTHRKEYNKILKITSKDTRMKKTSNYNYYREKITYKETLEENIINKVDNIASLSKSLLGDFGSSMMDKITSYRNPIGSIEHKSYNNLYNKKNDDNAVKFKEQNTKKLINHMTHGIDYAREKLNKLSDYIGNLWK